MGIHYQHQQHQKYYGDERAYAAKEPKYSYESEITASPYLKPAAAAYGHGPNSYYKDPAYILEQELRIKLREKMRHEQRGLHGMANRIVEDIFSMFEEQEVKVEEKTGSATYIYHEQEFELANAGRKERHHHHIF